MELLTNNNRGGVDRTVYEVYNSLVISGSRHVGNAKKSLPRSQDLWKWTLPPLKNNKHCLRSLDQSQPDEI